MRPIIPQLAWTGISISVYTALLVPVITETVSYKSKSEQFELSMLAMVALGVGEIFGALSMGVIVDRFGPKKACLVNVFLIVSQTVLVIRFMLRNEYSYLAFFVTFVWGVQDSSISIHLDAILAGEF